MLSNTDIDHFADLTAQLVKQPWQQVGCLRSQGSEQPSCPGASSVIKSWSCGPAERVDLVLREAVYPPDTHRFLILMAHFACWPCTAQSMIRPCCPMGIQSKTLLWVLTFGRKPRICISCNRYSACCGFWPFPQARIAAL